MGGALCIEGAVRLPLDSGAGGVAGIIGCLAMVQVITNIMYFGWIVDMNVYNWEKSTLSQGTTSFRGGTSLGELFGRRREMYFELASEPVMETFVV